MKYGTVDLKLLEMLRPLLGDQAEIVRFKPLTFDGGVARAVVKATPESMPDGADSESADLPHYEVELRQTVTLKFVRA